VSVKRKPARRFPAEPLTLADVEALRAACSRRAPTGIRNRALLAVLFRSGLRISEALALYPKDLDPAGRSIRVLHGKGNKARTAPLPTDAAEALDRWLDCRKRLRLTGRHPVFCTLNGEPLWDSYVRTLCKRLAAKAGVEKRVHPHGFRHGWALGQVESGTSLPVIQLLLGHSSLSTTATSRPRRPSPRRRPGQSTWPFSRKADFHARALHAFQAAPPPGTPGTCRVPRRVDPAARIRSTR
jgi:integrase/recombinase XerD